MSTKFKLKKGDEVIVLTGKDKGKTGKIIKMIPKQNKAIVWNKLYKIKSFKIYKNCYIRIIKRKIK